MSFYTPTPKERRERIQAKIVYKRELVSSVFDNDDLRRGLLSLCDYLDQLRFIRVNKRWFVPLRNEEPSVFFVLNCLYHTMCFVCPDVCYNPITQETISGDPGTEYCKSYYLLIKLDPKDKSYYPARETM